MSDPFGLLIVDKPEGPTSHDVVGMARKAVGLRRIGHTGTLDPMASGVLVLCIGKATRLAEYLTGHDKRYRATIAFGAATDTYDAAGEVTATSPNRPSRSALEDAIRGFQGVQMQRPPAYSALRTKGRRAHQLARAGKPVDLDPREVTIHSLDIVRSDLEHVVLDIHCSTGTYVRSLAFDLGEALGTYGHIAALRRTECGAFTEEQATPPEALADGKWKALMHPANEGLIGWVPCTLDRAHSLLVGTGRRLPGPMAAADGGESGARPPRIQALGVDGTLLGLMEHDPANDTYRSVKVFTTKEELEEGTRDDP